MKGKERREKRDRQIENRDRGATHSTITKKTRKNAAAWGLRAPKCCQHPARHHAPIRPVCSPRRSCPPRASYAEPHPEDAESRTRCVLRLTPYVAPARVGISMPYPPLLPLHRCMPGLCVVCLERSLALRGSRGSVTATRPA